MGIYSYCSIKLFLRLLKLEKNKKKIVNEYFNENLNEDNYNDLINYFLENDLMEILDLLEDNQNSIVKKFYMIVNHLLNYEPEYPEWIS